jgi:hypothetical protein
MGRVLFTLTFIKSITFIAVSEKKNAHTGELDPALSGKLTQQTTKCLETCPLHIVNINK